MSHQAASNGSIWQSSKAGPTVGTLVPSPRADQGKIPRNHKEDLLKEHVLSRLPARDPIACFRCLGLGHWAKSCRSKIRCRYCFIYGHIEAFYRKKSND
jgi:hypothetical protein